MLTYILPFIILIFQASIGAKVATKNEINNNDCDINVWKLVAGNKVPINIDFEKSGLGNKRIPPINPTIIATYAFFSVNFLE